jgi:paraquat-inducible protein B
VEVVMYPERVIRNYAGSTTQAQAAMAIATDEQKRHALIRHLVEDRGMRAQLKSGSLVTGQLYVSLDYQPGAPKVKLDLSRDITDMPVIPSALAGLQDELGSIVAKIDRMPLEAVGNDVKKDLEKLDTALASADKLISRADEQLVPGLKADVEDLHRTLNAVEHATNSASGSLLQSDAATQQDLRDALQEFTRAARSLRALTDMLEQQPTSVIRGKSEQPSGGR